jgi:ribosomal protein S18 acetylase RimI-like enzyme
MQSGSKEGTSKELTFERATNLAALHLFICGQEVVDKIIHEELPDLLGQHDLYYVKANGEVVALFCIQKDPHNLFFSDEVKEKMKAGTKPKPKSVSGDDDEFWDKFFCESIELSLLAVKEEHRGYHIGSFIIETVLDILSHDPEKKQDFLIVRALNLDNYSAIPFYSKCDFYPATKQVPGENLMMYHIIPKSGN